jgi:hypothetical protein
VQIRRTLLAAIVVLGLAVSGCGDSGDEQQDDTVATPTGLSVSVLQWRTDYTIRRMQLEVTNAGPSPVTVTAARLTSTAFTGVTVWQSRDQADETRIAPGTSTDLPAALPASNCGNTAGLVSTAQVSLRSADGRIGQTVALPVRDPFGSILRVHTEDCRRAAALEIAALTLVKPLRTTTRNGQLVGLLDLRLTPSGKPGTLTVQSIGTTTLLAPLTGAAWQVNREVKAGSGPQTVTLELRPARCDPHAIAEDKLGTVLPLTLRVDNGESGVVTVAADKELRNQIQVFVHNACTKT